MIIYILIIIILLYIYNQNNVNKKKQISETYKENILHLDHSNIRNDSNHNTNDIKYNKNILNNYDYFINDCDLCPTGSYKQCSNNYKNYPPKTNCNAYNLTQDLCKEKYSQKFLLHKRIFNNWDTQKNIQYSESNPRVNIWISSNL